MKSKNLQKREIMPFAVLQGKGVVQWAIKSLETSLHKMFTAFLVLCVLVIFFLGNAVQAGTLEELSLLQKSKVEDSLNQLNSLRRSIEGEKVPMVRELNQLEAKAKALYRQVEESRAARDSRSIAIETLESKILNQQKQYDYITRTLFSEYVDTFEANLSIGERSKYSETITHLNLLLESPDTSERDKLQGMLNVVEQSLDRIHEVLGVSLYDGELLNAEGIIDEGTFAQIGPILYFAGASATQSGLVEESKSLQAKLVSVNDEVAREIYQFIENREGTLPIDTSLGNALAIEQTKDSILEHLKKGGVWVYPILFFAFISTLVGIVKFIQIFTIREPNPAVVHKIIHHIQSNDLETAKKLASEQPEPCKSMLIQAVEHANYSDELVEEVMYENMLNTQPKLERYLNVIAVTAAIAPLLGLLGTVTGIIKTFKLMHVFGAGDPKPLISGISEALITTELGLILAIPALIIHALLSRKVAGVLSRMEKMAVAFMNSLSRHRKEAKVG